MLLDKFEIKALTTEEVVEKIGIRSYELFDFYVEIDDRLLCIDVKNWSSTLDKAVLSKGTHHKALTKIKTVSDYVGSKYSELNFIYLNGRLENNALNHEQEVSHLKKLFYLNLFKEESSYKPKQRRNSDGELTPYYEGSQLNQRVALNSVLSNLLQGKF